MNHADLLAAAVGILITVAFIVIGAWLDLRRGGHGDEPHGKAHDTR
jgi:hypothetical protein